MDGPQRSLWFFVVVDQKYTKETIGPNMSKRVCLYIWVYIINCSFVFDEEFVMHSLRKKSLSETCVIIDRNLWMNLVALHIWNFARSVLNQLFCPCMTYRGRRNPSNYSVQKALHYTIFVAHLKTKLMNATYIYMYNNFVMDCKHSVRFTIVVKNYSAKCHFKS